MKVGDKVICINTDAKATKLKLNTPYTVCRVTQDEDNEEFISLEEVDMHSEKAEGADWFSSRFKVIKITKS